MSKHLKLLGAALVLALSAGTLMAGDYHTDSSLICSDCHTMHYSISHTYTGGPTTPLTGGPYVGLLKADANTMCLQCHDGQTFAPDVIGLNTGTNVREAGALTTGVAPYEDWKGHTLGVPNVVAPGGTFNTGTTGLECLNCHVQHGQSHATYPAGYTNKQYRNLQSKPGTAPTDIALAYAIGTNDTTLPIFERDATLGQVGIHYSVNNVDFNEPDTTKSAFGEWCQGCHTVFHGAANEGTAKNWFRHPTAGIKIGTPGAAYFSSLTQFTGHTNRVKVMNPTGNWDAGQTDFTPSCFSCHKSHGNQNAFGLIYMKGTGVVTEEGDDGTQAKNLCRQCHIQGTDA
ncbi:MAG TPA: hypothetical protein VGM51_15070 [Armatimonadota bacterium]|jgi:hypothetical protein